MTQLTNYAHGALLPACKTDPSTASSVITDAFMVLNYFLSLITINIIRIGLVIGQSLLLMGPLQFSSMADGWSLIFFSLLRLISSIVFIWSYYYMDSEEQYTRFILIVILFVRSIVALIFFCRLFGAIVG